MYIEKWVLFIGLGILYYLVLKIIELTISKKYAIKMLEMINEYGDVKKSASLEFFEAADYLNGTPNYRILFERTVYKVYFESFNEETIENNNEVIKMLRGKEKRGVN